jgi:hypothetical protein
MRHNVYEGSGGALTLEERPAAWPGIPMTHALSARSLTCNNQTAGGRNALF